MIERFVKAWDQNKDKLKEHIATHPQEEYNDYHYLVKLLFDIVITPTIYDTSKIHEIDDGCYSGTAIFIIPPVLYEPDIKDYVYTSVDYGSCSCCDTLMRIQDLEDNYGKGLPTDRQIEDYMTLCLHLLQNCREMGSEND